METSAWRKIVVLRYPSIGREQWSAVTLILHLLGSTGKSIGAAYSPTGLIVAGHNDLLLLNRERNGLEMRSFVLKNGGVEAVKILDEPLARLSGRV